jgi:hypothetical protein
MPDRITDPLRALIAQLFGNGEQGAMYVPQPTLLGEQVLYQDAAGTTPVTADGDPVGLMLDLSGNGNHATQGTSAARPIYRTDGVLYWLEFDGVDDAMTVASSAITGRLTLAASTDATITGQHGILATSGGLFRQSSLYLRNQPGAALAAFWGEAPNIKGDYQAPSVVRSYADDGAGTLTLYQNGAEVQSVAASGGLFGPFDIGFANVAAPGRYLGRMFGIMVSGAEQDASKMAGVDNYLASLAGFSL